jgi:hypothetical protein
MRAWTIVLFIVAIHACLAMFNITNITNAGVGVVIDTSSKNGFSVTTGNNSMILLPNDSTFFNASASDPSEVTNSSDESLLGAGDFVSKFIESIFQVGIDFLKFMNSFKDAIFSIHALGAPIFGDFNAWILEGMVDFVFGVSLFQLVTGRSFKTME